MRRALRAGLLASALLTAPLATAATASAIPLEPQSAPATVQAPGFAPICTMQYPPTLQCWLASMSASVSGIRY